MVRRCGSRDVDGVRRCAGRRGGPGRSDDRWARPRGGGGRFAGWGVAGGPVRGAGGAAGAMREELPVWGLECPCPAGQAASADLAAIDRDEGRAAVEAAEDDACGRRRWGPTGGDLGSGRWRRSGGLAGDPAGVPARELDDDGRERLHASAAEEGGAPRGCGAAGARPAGAAGGGGGGDAGGAESGAADRVAVADRARDAARGARGARPSCRCSTCRRRSRAGDGDGARRGDHRGVEGVAAGADRGRVPRGWWRPAAGAGGDRRGGGGEGADGRAGGVPPRGGGWTGTKY